MKKINLKYTILTFVFSVLLSAQSLFAKNELPAPKGSGGFDDGVVVGGAIDNLLPYLMAIAIVYGFYIVVKKINQNDDVVA